MNHQETQKPEERKKWFGRGIYGSKDVPIRLLDGVIGVFLAGILILTVLFAVKGGFYVTFDSNGGSDVPSQKHRYGKLIELPEEPVKPGYVFDGWITQEQVSWDFAKDNVGGDITLFARWLPAKITVVFDLNGGIYQDSTSIQNSNVLYGEVYGTLPVPQKEGYTFGGWFYSGNQIKEDSIVAVNGEHVLKAIWEFDHAFERNDM